MILITMGSNLPEKEVERLYRDQFLLPSDHVQDIYQDGYQHETWADVFWRRRFRHSHREDPELKFVFQTSPSNVLEIGAGYGRILQKLLEWKNKDTSAIAFTGIELCTYFQTYFLQYQNLFPSLQRVRMIFDNFLTTSALKDNYDVILLPMNTLANFPFVQLDSLFKTVHRYLTDEGLFLFSNYKITSSEQLIKHINKDTEYSGDLLVDLGSGLLTAEYYDFPSTFTHYGAESITYICYSTFSREYALLKRSIFRSSTIFLLSDYLKQRLSANGFSVVINDDSSHSSVYGVMKT